MEEHKVMDQPLASKSAEAPLEVSADVATTSATVPSAENTKKDKMKKSGKMEGKQKVGNKKKEDVQLKEIKNKKSKKKKKKKSDSSSSSSSSSSSDSDEDVHGHKKAKTAETWIWWGGVLGGLVLVIGGALLMVKVSKLSMQATAGGELGQEKRRNKIESQLPLGNVPIEPC